MKTISLTIVFPILMFLLFGLHAVYSLKRSLRALNQKSGIWIKNILGLIYGVIMLIWVIFLCVIFNIQLIVNVLDR